MPATVRAGLTLAVLSALVAMLAACGAGGGPEQATNGVEELPADQIERRARDAAGAARTVHLSGTVLTDDESYRIDMRLTRDGAVGEVRTEDATFELLRIGQDLYLRSDAGFWESEGIPKELESNPAQKLDGKYVKVPRDDPAYQELSGFTDKDVLLDGLLTLEGERETGDRGEIGGTPTIRVEAGGGEGGVLDVALTGEPYPLRLMRGGGAGEVSMEDWNEEFTPHRPKEEDVVDYGDDVISQRGQNREQDRDADGGNG